MNNTGKRTIGFLGGKEFLVVLVSIFACYLVIEKTGLFRTEAASFREIFHSVPVRVLSVFLSLNTLFGLFAAITARRGKKKNGPILFFIAIIVLVSALWCSIFTRFEGRAIRMEGASFDGFKQDYIQSTLYTARYAKLPELGILIRKIIPVPSADLGRLNGVSADIEYAGRTTGNILKGRLSAFWPFVSDWTAVTITDFGYVSTYVLYDLNENILESSPVYMRLFPPGREDYFEVMFVGYIFSVRLYPDVIEQRGAYTTQSVEPNNPLYLLRIVRNKDIAYNGPVKPDEKLKFDNVIISLGKPDMWVELSFVRDFGLPLATLGVLLLLVAVIILLAEQKRSLPKT